MGRWFLYAGGRRLVDASVPVFTGKIRTPRKIRALTSTAVFIEFVAQPSNDTQYTGFTLTFQKYGEITTSTETSTEASTLPLAPQSVNAEFTVYLSGLTPVGFAQNITEFKTAVKGMAVNFCTANSIDIIDNYNKSFLPTNILLYFSREKNVVILYAVQCPITWPNSDTCVQVTMSVPVVVLNDTAYEMTTIHLYQMWNQYSARDALLQELGLKVYSVPRTELTMYTWMGVSLGCLAIFAIILVLVWRLDIFANYSDSRLSGVSESQPKMSTTSQKSWIELPYQEFPPMGVDDFPEYEPDNLHTGKGVHINLHPLPSPTPKLPSYGPPQEYGAALHFFPTSFDNQALIEEDDDIDQKHDRNTSTS
ncbi:unnamed protein product [Timema podura]|uniref:CUB domain-containing protein n=1 Tax=Timema podura TaxID=61482 RepID=A0ABN7NKI9_TIMPD|nr:unnamed protein product [Timema podura]